MVAWDEHERTAANSHLLLGHKALVKETLPQTHREMEGLNLKRIFETKFEAYPGFHAFRGRWGLASEACSWEGLQEHHSTTIWNVASSYWGLVCIYSDASEIFIKPCMSQWTVMWCSKGLSSSNLEVFFTGRMNVSVKACLSHWEL